MPMYEFKCTACSRTKEFLYASLKAAPQYVYCTLCGALASREFPRSGFILRGEGWARDQYSSAPKSYGSIGEGCYSVKEGPRMSGEEKRQLREANQRNGF